MGMQGCCCNGAVHTPRPDCLGNKKFARAISQDRRLTIEIHWTQRNRWRPITILGNALVMQGQDSTANVAYGQALALSRICQQEGHDLSQHWQFFYASGLKSMREGGQTATQAPSTRSRQL
jgi:hypothetical protein